MQNGPVNRLETAWPTAGPLDRGGIELDSLSQSAKSWEGKVETFITDHPRLALGAAAACGLLLGWMVKRK